MIPIVHNIMRERGDDRGDGGYILWVDTNHGEAGRWKQQQQLERWTVDDCFTPIHVITDH